MWLPVPVWNVPLGLIWRHRNKRLESFSVQARAVEVQALWKHIFRSDGAAKDFAHFRLVRGFHQDFVNVDVRGTAGHPDQNFGNVAGHQRVHAGINRPGFCCIPLKANERKFCLRQAGVHGADPDTGAQQVLPQGAGDGG